MRAYRAVALAVFVFISLLSFAQEEKVGYFSLNSSRTYAPGQKVTVDMWAQNVETLEFRVYRVNDPVKFFKDLDDAHQFGGRVPAPPHKLTWLERFHDWKRGIYSWIRDFFRAQFTAENRRVIRERRTATRQQPQTPAQVFAQIPILNSQQLVATWKQNVPSGRERWETEVVNVPVKDRGVYLVEATDGKLRAYTIVIVSQMAIVTKTAPGTVLAFVVDRQSSQPVTNAQTYFFINRNQSGQQVTDNDGLAQIAVTEAHPENVLVMARTKDDFAVSSPWSYWMSTDPARSLTTYVYTDRPVYRPGDTVHFKAILRTRSGFTYQARANTEFNVNITDVEGKDVLTKTVKSSSLGTLNGEYAIPLNASLGDYNIQVRRGESYTSGGSFAVEEYKKPEYEVRVVPDSKRVLQGQPIQATIEARYYFGEPVANAKVTWVVHQNRVSNSLYTWEDDEDYSEYGGEGEGEGGDSENYYYGEQTEEKTGTLDADGKLRISLPTTFDASRKSDISYRIEARVTDEGNREITGRNYILATYGSFKIGANPTSYVYEVGKTAQINVDARDYDGKPIQTAFHIIVRTWDYRSRSGDEVFAADGQTDANGHAEVSIPITRGGSLRAIVTAATPENRQLEDTAYLWVPDRNWYWGGSSERIQIVPDQKSYKPGDTAKLLIMAGPDPVSILVTTEGMGLHSRQVIRSKGGPITVDVPVRTEYAPNFFVSAAYIKDNALHTGSKSINVPPDAYKLNVQIQPSKPQFQPGEAASYTIVAKDSNGKPVSGEFSIGVVDEAIYAIRPEATTDILKFFYGRTFNRVNTDSSLSYYFRGEAGKKQMRLAEVKRRNWLAQIKPERLVQPKIRKAFPDTAFWVADVRTGADGRATVKFSFPDSLTAWRATARGVTADTKVGSAVEKVIVRKNVMVRLVVPRFFRQGDQVTISAIVHNYLPAAKMARVSMDLKGLQVLEGSTRDVNVPSRGEVKVDWRVKADNVLQSTVLAKALTNEESDAMELSLPVIPYGVKMAVPQSGSLNSTTGEITQEINFPQRSEPSGRFLQVDLSPSAAGAIFGALQYLTSYPYGCTEQTMSSFLPNIIVADAVKQLGLKPQMDEKELNAKIEAGLKRLYDYQHEDGGWGWWQTDDSHVFMSTYVLAGLSQAKQVGYNVEQDRVTRAQGWVRQTFDNDKKIIADLRAYMAYSLMLSGANDKAILDSVWKQRSELSPYGAAMLGLAMDLVKDSRTTELATIVEKGAVTDEQTAHWSLNRDPMLDFETDASPEATAFAAKFLSKVRPESALLPKAAFWLVMHRNEGYWWNSTKQTAFVVYGLTDFLKQSGELKPSFSVEVLVNDRQIISHRFTEADAFGASAVMLRLTPEQLGQNNRVIIRKKGQGRLYWSLRGEYYSDEKKLTNVGSFNLTLAREYFKLSPVRENGSVKYKLESLSGPVQVGDTLAVRLTVSGSDWKYLMIEDPIPPGTEFIEHDNLYTLKDQPRWWSWYFTRREFHDDRAAFFTTYFWRGAREYVYMLKVVNPGVFRVSPGKVEPMYQPSYFATSDPLTLEVK
ncbi:MAG TPA: MG2 domain-containing protein [Terriglobales bacterium]|nr:MG2 domain-containing protein [Terriglobales bacterium]